MFSTLVFKKKILAVCEAVCNNIVQPDRPQTTV